MNNVIDFFSRKSYQEITLRDYQMNDELTDQYGIYIGCLIKQDVTTIRSLVGELDIKSEQIEQLTATWDALNQQYYEIIQNCLVYLNLPKTMNINLDKDSIMISEDGHAWVVHNYKDK